MLHKGRKSHTCELLASRKLENLSGELIASQLENFIGYRHTHNLGKIVQKLHIMCTEMFIYLTFFISALLLNVTIIKKSNSYVCIGKCTFVACCILKQRVISFESP